MVDWGQVDWGQSKFTLTPFWVPFWVNCDPARPADDSSIDSAMGEREVLGEAPQPLDVYAGSSPRCPLGDAAIYLT